MLCWGGGGPLNLQSPILISFLTLRCKAILYLTQTNPQIRFNFIIFNNPGKVRFQQYFTVKCTWALTSILSHTNNTFWFLCYFSKFLCVFSDDTLMIICGFGCTPPYLRPQMVLSEIGLVGSCEAWPDHWLGRDGNINCNYRTRTIKSNTVKNIH